MSREIKAPELINTAPRGDETYGHDAYGVITMAVSHGGIGSLFGSDVKHNSCISIEIKRATLTRGLSTDWIYGRKNIVRFDMSHAQFAEFITSVGKGDGTPITLTSAPPRETPCPTMPGLRNIEGKLETLQREVKEAARERTQAIQAHITHLGAMIEGVRFPKAELREIHKELKRHAEQLPGSLEFVVKSAEEALEKTVNNAKIEVESYVAMTAQRLGLKHIDELAKLEDK